MAGCVGALRLAMGVVVDALAVADVVLAATPRRYGRAPCALRGAVAGSGTGDKRAGAADAALAGVAGLVFAVRRAGTSAATGRGDSTAARGAPDDVGGGSFGQHERTRHGARRQVVDRLTAAKAVLSDFLDRRDGDRVGLLVFGQRAYALTPLTADLTSVRDQLRDSVVGLAGRETAIGDAIALSVKRLREQKQGQRVVVLLTDGVNTAGVLNPLKAAELAKAEGVRVHTIAFGGSGGYSLFGVPIPAGGDDDIDEDGLRKIAQQTGGRFFRARDTDELAGIYAELDRLEPVKGLGPSVQPRVERYYWPLGAAIVIALLAYVLPRRWR